MNWNILSLWIFSVYCSCTVYGLVYTDCERPPTILHGITKLSIDEEGINVFAIYSCEPDYQLDGEAQLNCNTDTDEWQGNLPACKLVTGNNSSVSEIEPPEVIGTASPDITHEEIAGPAEEPTAKQLNEVENGPGESVTSETEAPQQMPSQTEIQEQNVSQNVIEQQLSEHELPGHEDSSKTVSNPEPSSEEDNNIDMEYASRLDMSCIDARTAAPPIKNAFVADYIEASKGDYTFLVVVYQCDVGSAFENPQYNRLYCSQREWIHNNLYPTCVSTGEPEEDYDNETDDVDQNEIDDTNRKDVQQPTTNSAQQNAEIDQHANTIENIPASPVDSNINEQINTNEIMPPQPSEPPMLVENSVSCDVNNGGCEQNCNMVPNNQNTANVVECSCNDGFYSDGGVKCLDINECESYPNMQEVCPFGCENTIGSYHCREGSDSDVEIIATNVDESHTTEISAPVKACGNGMILDASNNCVDIDECAEGNTGCEHCQNIVGSYECTCPDGFELSSDQKTCRDIDECTAYAEYDYEENRSISKSICSHECINTAGSYVCKCPDNFHLLEDKQHCEQDFCRHLSDIASNKTKCSHDCIDEADGYHCKCPDGMVLQADQKTCIELNMCQTSGDRCLPGKCIGTEDGSFRCDCPAGFTEHNQRCVDFDECAMGTHECSHQCKNIDGSYLCECPAGLTLTSDQHTCISEDYCAGDNGGCSDICNVINEQVTCSCLDGSELDVDGKTCRRKNICTTNNGGCAHICNVELNICECNPGFETFNDGKTCRDLNECLLNNGGCPQQCINTEGDFKCTCFDGFTEDEQTGECKDRNECEVNNGNCDQECTNTVGSYFCSCRAGYRIDTNQHQCFDINECEMNNGNCSHQCTNMQGSYKCSCPEGFKLDHDKVTCLEIKDTCTPLSAPQYGNVHCSRSRHASHSFYQTRCSMWCNKGYTMIGPSVKFCNGSTGIWDATETTCVPSTCPPLPKPTLGTLPENCLTGKITLGESCAVICPPGTKNNGAAVAQCLPTGQWSITNLNCIAINPHPRGRISQGEIHSRGKVDLDEPLQPVQPIQHKTISTVGSGQRAVHPIQTHRTSNIIRPYIKCPRDTTIVLPNNQKTAYIRLEQPKSNVNWATHVDANPAWAKKLQAHLGAGIHTITFTARSPNSMSISEACVTVITVKSLDVPVAVVAPRVRFCPKNIEVQLQPHEKLRPIYWDEPIFHSKQPLKQIFKSNLRGSKFGVGHHRITYIATDIHNQNGTCQFSVIVHPAVARMIAPYMAPQYQNRLEESYLICPDRPAMKIDTSFPIQIPVGCFIKKFFVNPMQPYNPHRRRHAISPNNNFLRYYSSWNQPVLNRHLV